MILLLALFEKHNVEQYADQNLVFRFIGGIKPFGLLGLVSVTVTRPSPVERFRLTERL